MNEQLQRFRRTWKILNPLFLAIVGVPLLNVLGVLPLPSSWLLLVWAVLVAIFYFLISIYFLNKNWTILLFFVFFSIGFLYDFLLIHFGFYLYQPSFLMLGTIPLVFPLIWFAALAQTYHFSNSFFTWKGLSKPNVKRKNLKFIFFLLLLDGLTLAAMGGFMEYLVITSGLGTWLKADVALPPQRVWFSYFFMGFFSIGLFRWIEYFSQSIDFQPLIGILTFRDVYLVTFLISSLILIQTEFSPFFVILLLVQGVILASYFTLYFKSKKEKKK